MCLSSQLSLNLKLFEKHDEILSFESTCNCKVVKFEGSSRVGFAVVQLLSCVQLLATPWTAALQAPLSFTLSLSLLSLMSSDSVMLSNYLIFCRSVLVQRFSFSFQ